MKVDAQEPAAGASRQARPSPDGERFKKTLEETEPRDAPKAPRRVPAATAGAAVLRPTGAPSGVARAAGSVLTPQRSAISSPESLGRQRHVMHAEVQRLGAVRSEAQTQGQERTEHRLQDLIARELAKDARPTTAPTPAAPRATPGPLQAEPPRPSQESSHREGALSGAGALAGGGAPTEHVQANTRAEAALALIERIDVFVKSQRPALSMSLRGHLDATVEVERTGPREVALRVHGRRGPVAAEELGRLREALEARGLRLSALRAD